MLKVRTRPARIRVAWATVLAFVLALRLLTPAGFMPEFEHGAITIVACPDFAPAAASAAAHHHHRGDPKKAHQPCPYASASWLGALAADLPFLAALLVMALALLLGREFGFVERKFSRERPPVRGPPLPA